MKVKIVQVSRKERTSSKTGKPFTSLGLKTEEHGEKWLSGFGNKDNANWKSGDSVEIDVEQKGEYLNFTTPKSDQSPAARDGATAELKNILTLKVVPMLSEILARLPDSSLQYPEYGEHNDAHDN